jgi:hypothetical protein
MKPCLGRVTGGANGRGQGGRRTQDQIRERPAVRSPVRSSAAFASSESSNFGSSGSALTAGAVRNIRSDYNRRDDFPYLNVEQELSFGR